MERALAGNQVDDWLRRAFDVSVAAVGLAVLSPFFVIVAITIRTTSSGPIFFRQKRVGLDGALFDILKFRSMRSDAEKVGGQLTIGEDDRITPVGHYLRAWKLDELPQLINVLRGEMALVGPRPEVPRYVALYSPEQRRVLTVRPGITDPASVAFRSESDLMASEDDPEQFYIREVMPEKLRINLEYLKKRNLLTDIGVIFSTLLAVLRRGNQR